MNNTMPLTLASTTVGSSDDGRDVRTASITVTFNPDPDRLAKQVCALLAQTTQIFIVDNGSTSNVENVLTRPEFSSNADLASRITFIELQQNQGIATAFNAGAEAAIGVGAEFVLLLDQDSIPANDMIAKLVAGFRRATIALAASSMGTVAAVGPRITDARSKSEFPFITFGWLSNKHNRCKSHDGKLIATDFLISSGALLSIAAFKNIGRFDDALFIDNVDLEWCCRARSRGFSLYGVCDAELNHQLGHQRRIFFSLINHVVHSPSRVYYQTRNRLLLYRRGYMPLKWKLKDILRLFAKFSTTILFIAPRLEYMRMTILGIRDGLANRGGKMRTER
ncbi:MAG: glycosyltransferase family 2 protein [Betaproteobacteria bacterium]